LIQDIFPDRLRNEYAPKAITDESIVFCFNDGKVLCKTTNGIVFPLRKNLDCSEYRYLFNLSGTDCFLAAQGSVPLTSGFSYENTGVFRDAAPRRLAFAGVTALHLNNWYTVNRLCGRCGHPMTHDRKERMVKCLSCGNQVYPQIAPVVIVGVTDGSRLLMTRYAGRHRMYALVAGFIEIGETVEEAVKREVMEETGVKVNNIRYYKSQPWGFSQSLLFGFYADLDGTADLTVDQVELSEAVWVEKEDIDVTLDNLSLTNEMICHFKGLI